MRDYGDLVGRLRICPDYNDGCKNCPHEHDLGCRSTTMREAADAIEELQSYADLYKELTEKGQTVARKLIDAYPKWISVDERLPEAMPGNYSLDVLVTDGERIAIFQYFNVDGSVSMWGYSGIGKITHWMPMPEPPKEEK